MSGLKRTNTDSERPPGPHEPEVQYVAAESPKSPRQDSRKSPSGGNRDSRSDHRNSKDSDESKDSKDPTRQRFVLTDPIAFRYLEDDASVTVLERRRELVGYEIYVVEQWATSRSHPTFVITTYTGDPTHRAYVGVLSVPTDESSWSQRLRVYFKALNQYHARRRETPLGILMITNLSGFPSSLTVITVPDGDLRKHRFDFFVNENLKRMGCSGRVGLSLAQPNGATTAKFHQLYRTSDKNPLYSAVIELVKLCQAALHLYDKLEIDYADGLLCDVTEKAVNDWWLAIGSEFHNIEPHDGILGPTTVVALLGLLMGARNRMHAINISVPKDPFDMAPMKRAIGSFQKSQRINRTRRLDRETLSRLHRASAKAASSEGWSVPRAVKSTVAELSGKGGEMLAEVVGRRDKAGISEIETSDIERFTQLVYGERCRWLWQGKPLKSISMDNELAVPERHLILQPDENGGYTWTGDKDATYGAQNGKSAVDVTEQDLEPTLSSKEAMEDLNAEEPAPHKSVIRRATGRINVKGATGFGRFKDAVRGHHRGTPSKDDQPHTGLGDTEHGSSRPSLWRSHTSPPVSPTSPVEQEHKSGDALKPPENRNRAASYSEATAADKNLLLQTPEESRQGFIPLGRQSLDEKAKKDGQSSAQDVEDNDTASTRDAKADEQEDAESNEPSIAGSFYHGIDLHDILPEPQSFAQEIGPLLRRTNSLSTFITANISKPRADDYFPRHLSFSVAEESTINPTIANTLSSHSMPTKTDPIETQFAYEVNASSDLKEMRALIAKLDSREAAWTRSQLFALRALLDKADGDTQEIEQLYYEPLTTLQDLHDSSAALIRDEKDALGEAAKELEALSARMDYEIGAMRGKIEDVEVGVQDFERAVGAVEDRVKDLEDGEGKGGKICVVM
ncbi:hypothetical protein AAFC00_003109 [Neodothiora populina]|uniref:STB6-like N-terminal domain-containing protein n=1 Tax=Neodothiora populina TaxID=2781224 RepID=A0ABR3P9C3_9PEZI